MGTVFQTYATFLRNHAREAFRYFVTEFLSAIFETQVGGNENVKAFPICVEFEIQ